MRRARRRGHQNRLSRSAKVSMALREGLVAKALPAISALEIRNFFQPLAPLSVALATFQQYRGRWLLASRLVGRQVCMTGDEK
jgi:hypothetical protein